MSLYLELKKEKINFKLISPNKVKSNIDTITYFELFNKETNYNENTELLTKEAFNFFSKQKHSIFNSTLFLNQMFNLIIFIFKMNHYDYVESV